MAEYTPSDPRAEDPQERFERDRNETQQGFERDEQDVVAESADNADELYSGELSGEVVDPELLHGRQGDEQARDTNGNG